MIIDYIRVYQNTTIDSEPPTNFTASVGAVTGSSVELLMNATDNSGTIGYTISYIGGTITVYHPSGVQKSVVIPDLASSTNYTFTITATDVSGNSVANSQIVLNATTTSVLQCAGTDSQATESSFTVGYNYNFQTIGTDVKITFELLDDRVGVVAFLRRQSPFSETQMTNVGGQIFTHTISGQTIGTSISYAVKFAYAGGLSVTRYFSYVVGSNCGTSGLESTADLMEFSFTNPANDVVEITSDFTIDKIELFDLSGNKVVSAIQCNKLEVSNIPKGIYLIAVYSGKEKKVKKIVVN